MDGSGDRHTQQLGQPLGGGGEIHTLETVDHQKTHHSGGQQAAEIFNELGRLLAFGEEEEGEESGDGGGQRHGKDHHQRLDGC